MKYKSAKTPKGNIGVSYESQELADAQAVQMDDGGNIDCYSCSSCSDCISCIYCRDCRDCIYCSDCSDCIGILRWTGPKASNLIAINGIRWQVSTNGAHIQIGCQQHSVERWEGFSDDVIARMDKDALDFWRQFKPTIMAMAAYRASLGE